MEYKPIKKQIIEQHKPKEYDEDEDDIPGQEPEEKEHRQPNVQVYSLPTLHFSLEIGRDIAVNLTAAGLIDEEARKSFGVLVKLLNEKINLHKSKKKGERPEYIN